MNVSIVIRTRAGSRNLEECLRAVSRQEYGASAEVLVVEMGPCDEQNQTAASRYRAKYVFGEATTELAACNAAARHATADVVACLDDDSLPQPGWLGALLAPFAIDAVLIVAGRIQTYSGKTDDPPSDNAYPQRVRRGVQPHEEGDLTLYMEVIASGLNVAFRRAFIEEFGGFDDGSVPAVATGSFGKLGNAFPLVAAGYTLVHAPQAVILHP